MSSNSVSSNEGVQFEQFEESTSLLVPTGQGPVSGGGSSSGGDVVGEAPSGLLQGIGGEEFDPPGEGILIGSATTTTLVPPGCRTMMGVTIILLLAVGVGLAARWIFQLGGLVPSLRVSNATVFNWHPTLMLLAFVFMTVGALAFRVIAVVPRREGHARIDSRRRVAKLVHSLSWGLSAVCLATGLVAVFRSHNNPDRPIANLYSFHSWMGIAVTVAYAAQLTVAFMVFYGLKATTPTARATVLRYHRAVGPVVYLCAALTILLGIQEKEGFVGCAYVVTMPDTVPFRHVRDIPPACWTSHVLGFVVLLVAILTAASWGYASSPIAYDIQQGGRRSR